MIQFENRHRWAPRSVRDWLSYELVIRWVSVLMLVVSAFLFLRPLPIRTAAAHLHGLVLNLSVEGYLAFAAAYIIAALVLAPRAVLMLAAGATFGTVAGFILALVCSTAAAILAFLLARHAFPNRVQAVARRSPWFGILDGPISQGVWTRLLLLRLSPAVRHGSANYLLGVTRVRLAAFTGTTFLALAPWALTNAWLGDIGLDAIAGELTSLQSFLLGLGVTATIAGTIYLSHLTRHRLRERSGQTPATSRRTGMAGSTFLLSTLGLVSLAILPLRDEVSRLVSRVFGPPAVTMQETFAQTRPAAGPVVSFDHSGLDQLLHRHVDELGLVDYAALAAQREQLDAYIAQVADAPFENLPRDEKLALLINAYNAFMLQLVLDHPEAQDVLRDIPEPFKRQRWILAGRRISLDELEHRWIRGNFREPRIHWALVCGAISCPRLRSEAYTGARLEAQLEEQARFVHRSARYVQLEGQMLRLTPLYDWYAGDFEQAAGSVLEAVARYRPDVKTLLGEGRPVRVQFFDYSWKLNSQQNRPLLENDSR